MKTGKRIKLLICLALICGTLFSSVISASAASYTLRITSPIKNSLKSTDVIKKASTAKAYVQPEKILTNTGYFLSPTRFSSTEATFIVSKTNTSKSNFTYRSGYGGVGQSYCLSVFPNVSGAYNAYTANGIFTV